MPCWGFVVCFFHLVFYLIVNFPPQRFFRHGDFSATAVFRHSEFFSAAAFFLPRRISATANFFPPWRISATADCSRGGFPPQGEIFPLRSASGRKFSVRHAPLRPGKNLKNLHPCLQRIKKLKVRESALAFKTRKNTKKSTKITVILSKKFFFSIFGNCIRDYPWSENLVEINYF